MRSKKPYENSLTYRFNGSKDPKRERSAIAEALKLRQAFDGELHLLNVIPEFNNKLFRSLYAENVGEEAEKCTKKSMQEFCERYLPTDVDYKIHIANGIPTDVDYKIHIANGIVYKEILQTAESLDVDLIVITASRPELADYLMGPNTGKVVRHSNCSVLVVRE